MARRRPGLVAIRRIIAGAFIFVGLFVFCFGIGNGRQSVMVAGVAIVVLAFIGRITGTFRRTTREWLAGTATVLGVNEPPPEARYGRCSLDLVTNVPGMPTETVQVHESRVPVDQWPKPGQELPIQVAADDPRNVRVRWRNFLPGEAGSGQFEDLQDRGPVETTADAFWADDQPTPVPAEPPGSHLDPPEPALIDFDIDNPPVDPLAPAAAASTADEGEINRGTSPVRGPVVPAPRTRPSPRPRPSSAPPAPPAPTVTAPAAASAAATTAIIDPVTSDPFGPFPNAHPGPAGAIHGLGITVLVSDLDRAVEFYVDKLGFYQADQGEGNLVLASGETRLLLRQWRDRKPVDVRPVHINLVVADIDAMYEQLKANGIKFTYPPRPVNRTATSELWAAPFQDPDGNGIAITQWRRVA
ncbi:MAG TPA: VOC family protein [Natronosporangium sp.]